MKKTKFKPQNDQLQDMAVFSISTIMADYKLAFELNQHLELNLTKQDDLPVYVSGEKPVLFPFFYFENEDKTAYYLVENRTAGDPMMKNFMLFVDGYLDENEAAQLPDHVNTIQDIFNCSPINLHANAKKGRAAKKLKLIGCIISDLEYHLLEISRSHEEKKVKLKPTRDRRVRKLYN